MTNKNNINNIKKLYSTYNSLSVANITDDVIIKNLLKILDLSSKLDDLAFLTLLSDYISHDKPSFIDVIELIGLVHQKRREKELISNTDARKHNGIYYTNYSIAKRIAEEAISLFGDEFDPAKTSFLEPCSGMGIFAIAYIDTVLERNSSNLEVVQKIIDNMYFADIDGEAVSLMKQIIPIYLRGRYNVLVKIPSKNIFVGDVLFNNEGGNIVKNDLKKIFNKTEGFDLVLTNPPYKLLKANQNKYNNGTNYKDEVDNLLNFIRKNDIYKFNFGTLNLYKLFIEEILENYTNEKGKIGLLIPATLLRDKQSYEIRERILDKYNISKIYTIPENNNFFSDITQAFCFFVLDKNSTSDIIELVTNVHAPSEFDKTSVSVSKNRVNSVSTLKEIISTDRMGWNILSKIHKNKKIKELPSITNLRGELDLTLDKKYITSDKTDYVLLRGNGIKEFTHNIERIFVLDNFINKLSGKGRFLTSERLVCQQISNVSVTKRLKFTKIPKNIVLGNSCNFIVVNNDSLFNENNISLNYLLGVLNSLLLDWRFQQTSSNNHIGNYELDELPVAVPNDKQKDAVEYLSKQLIEDPDNGELKSKLNSIVFDIYGLNETETSYILNSYKVTAGK